MSVTVLFLVIFEAQSRVPEFQQIEKFLVYQCLLLVADLLFFLFRSVKPLQIGAGEENQSFTQRLRALSCTEGLNAFISLVLYLTQVAWLIYGNYIYFNLPVDSLEEANEDYAAQLKANAQNAAATDSILTHEEINSEKWLYVALLSVLTVGYIHLMIFAAIVLIAVFSMLQCCFASIAQPDQSVSTQSSTFSALKLWQFIDEGIFSLLDELEENDDYIY